MSAPLPQRAELRAFLRACRARVSPEEVGLPAGGSRRSPGLRREEVAVLASVGASWYTWLEQGRDINVSGKVLDGVSRALRLNDVERAHLYRLAGLNPPAPAPETGTDETVVPHLRRLLDSWMPSPAYVIDRYWNVLAANEAARAVFLLKDSRHNCLLTFFTGDGGGESYPEREAVAQEIAAQLREERGRYPDDPHFDRLLDRLSVSSTEFREVWERHEVLGRSPGTKLVRHPSAGRLVFEHTTLRTAERADPRLVMFTAQPGTDTEWRLRRLLADLRRQEEQATSAAVGESVPPAVSAAASARR